MKKIILSSILAFSALTAATDEQILSVYGGAPANVKIEISGREPIKGLDGYEAVFVKFSSKDGSAEEVIITKGDLIFSDVIDVKNKTFFKEDIQKIRTYKNIADIYNNEKSENIIKLGNDKSKPTMVVFTDAECPYCRREMSAVEERLKNNNIEIVMTSVHGKSGHAKSFLIYKEMKTAKTDADKIKILRKYYDDTLPADITKKIDEAQTKEEKIAILKKYNEDTLFSKVSDEEISKMTTLTSKYMDAGIRGVPFILDKAEITKK